MREFDYWVIVVLFVLIFSIFYVYMHAESEIYVTKEIAYDALDTASDANDRIIKLENQVDSVSF